MRNQMLGQRIRYIRESKHLSQSELAELIGTNQQQVSYWETGKYSPQADFVIQLAHVLQTTPNYLLGFTDDPAPGAPPAKLTDEEQELLDTYRKLPNRQRELMRFARFISNPE